MKSLAVFCGSRSGSDPVFMAHAAALGTILAAKQVTMVYGGGSKGLMGAVADAVMDGQGRVTGVIPELLIAWEAQHLNLTELIVVTDMHARKKMMYELCDAALVLAGGFGTLDELFEMLTWNSLKIHDKHIYILNSNGFYDHLVAHLHTMYDSEFLYDRIENRIIVLREPSDLLAYLPAAGEV